MQTSAELRWFWRGSVPKDFGIWFRQDVGAFPAGGGDDRADEYLVDPKQVELGIKLRGKKTGIEVKGLVHRLSYDRSGSPLRGEIEIWSKWSSDVLTLRGLPTMVTRKTRWLRKYQTRAGEIQEIALKEDELPREPSVSLPAHGCNVELTQILLPDQADTIAHWWTFGFEAFGSLNSVESNLQQTLELFAALSPPIRTEGRNLSYPAWMALSGFNLREPVP